MNALIDFLNLCGAGAREFAWAMLWQSSLLIGLLLGLEWAFRRRVRAAVRYALWLVVMVKLVLPPTLALPTGLGWWLRPAPEPIRAVPPSVRITCGPDAAEPGPSRTPPPVAALPPRPALSLEALGLPGSAAISLGLLAGMMFRWRRVAGEARGAAFAPGWLQTLLEETGREAGLRGGIQLRLLDQPISPAVYGLLRPVILLPRCLGEKLNPAQLRAVLLHELIHLRRRDVWVNCAQALLQLVYWWHPLVWVANERIRRVREEAVDDAVSAPCKPPLEPPNNAPTNTGASTAGRCSWAMAPPVGPPTPRPTSGLALNQPANGPAAAFR